MMEKHESYDTRYNAQLPVSVHLQQLEEYNDHCDIPVHDASRSFGLSIIRSSDADVYGGRGRSSHQTVSDYTLRQ